MRSTQSGLEGVMGTPVAGKLFGQLNSAEKFAYHPSSSSLVLRGPLHESAGLSISCVIIRCRAWRPNIVRRSPVSRTRYVMVRVPPWRVRVVVGGGSEFRLDTGRASEA